MPGVCSKCYANMGRELTDTREALENQREVTRHWLDKYAAKINTELLDCQGRGHSAGGGSELCRECLLMDKIVLGESLRKIAPSHPALRRLHRAPHGMFKLFRAWALDICVECEQTYPHHMKDCSRDPRCSHGDNWDDCPDCRH